MPEVLTAAQVAELLQLHVKTVFKLAHKGEIPGKLVGGSWRFSRDRVLRMLEEGSELIEKESA